VKAMVPLLTLMIVAVAGYAMARLAGAKLPPLLPRKWKPSLRSGEGQRELVLLTRGDEEIVVGEYERGDVIEREVLLNEARRMKRTLED
jgi:hypothetical protein